MSDKKVSERDWVKELLPKLSGELAKRDATLECNESLQVPYRHEIISYRGDDSKTVSVHDASSFQTDISVIERLDDDSWSPRVIVEVKLGAITTHDAITYSMKAERHKRVHPYLRYGILIAACTDVYIPRRLIAHGSQFDFMIAWPDLIAKPPEWRAFNKIVMEEVESSRRLFNFVNDGGKRDRERYSVIRRKLELS